MKVVWATDGSANADEALPFAKSLVGAYGGSLIAVYCNEILYGTAPGFPLHAEDVGREAKIRAQVDELRAEGLDAKLAELTGPVAEAASMIADFAASTDADVIVVGNRGHGPLAGVILGSLTQRLVHVALCPVVAVPSLKSRGASGRRGRRTVHA
jgi:nucleotide-binding universal stress UspA family protein